MKKILLLSLLTFLSLPVFAQSDEEPGEEPVLVVLHIRNGSRLQGTIKGVASLILKTPYGRLTIPLADVRSWTRGDSEEDEQEDVVRTRQGTFKGWLINGLEAYEVDTGFGILSVPAESIRSLHVRGTGLGDDFEISGLDNWQSFGGTWQVSAGTLTGYDPNGGYNTQLHYDLDLPESYVLRCKIRGDNLGVVWGAEGLSSMNLLWLSSGSFYLRTGTNWQNNNLATWSVSPHSDGFYHLRLEVDGARTVVFNNDIRLGEIATTSTGRRAGLFLYSGTGTFDDFLVEQ